MTKEKLCFPSAPKFKNFFLSIQTQFYSIYCHFRIFHIKLSDTTNSLFLPISSLVSVSRPGLEMSPAFKEKAARHPRVGVPRAHLLLTTRIAGTLRSCCSSCSEKAANSLYFQPVRAFLFPGAGPVHPRDTKTGRAHPSKHPRCFLAHRRHRHNFSTQVAGMFLGRDCLDKPDASAP